MSGPVTDAHRLTYKENIALALQQKTSQYEDAFEYYAGLSGRQAQILDLIGSTTAVVNLGRKADTPDIDNTVEPVWMIPSQLAWGKLIEREDAIKALTDFQSPFTQAGAAAMVRGKDVILETAFFASRKIGQDGSTTSAWAGDTVAVGIGASATDDTTATGMNVRKILRMRRYLMQRKVDLRYERVFLSLNAQGIEELFRDTTFINRDYREKLVLDKPMDLDVLGVTIMPANDGSATLADYDGSTYTAVGWVKSGMVWGEFDPLRVDAPLRPDKMNRPHPQMEQWLGATRTEDYKVVKILNKK